MTWSLYKIKEEIISDDKSGANLFNYDGEKLPPLKFSNQKTQEDAVKEVLDLIGKGHKLIFINGVCGSGKSAIALNLAKHFDKSSIVVPIKNLQKQYEQDYTNNHYILKDDKTKLKIAIIKGRNNFSCPFDGTKADDSQLPCTIELREKNMDQIKKFIDKNPYVDKTDFSSVSEVRRMSIAPACPYWSPLLPSEVKTRSLEDARRRRYPAVCGKEFALFQRKKGCAYCDQYNAYMDADVLIFNSAKYMVEIAIGRKPKTEIDIIDECDEFLDSFAEERKLNLNRLLSALSQLFPDNSEELDAVKDMIHLTNKIIQNPEPKLEKINNTKIEELFKKIIQNPYLAEEEDRSYYNTVLEIAKTFEHLMKETYVQFETQDLEDKTLFGRPEQTTSVQIVSINLAQKFQDIINSNNVLVLMSGTLHSNEVLRDIFGLKDFKIVEAETQQPGIIRKFRTGLEKNCKYENFKNKLVTREDYLKALQACVENADPPTLVHVSAFSDLPNTEEKATFNLTSVPSREEIIEMQKKSHSFDSFKSGEIDILFTTKCSRGVDFPGEKCNSIVITKYPYPNVRGLFWQILKQEQPEKFMTFYLDKARRELVQKIARGLRFKEDTILLLSPDTRVLDARLK